MSFWGVSDVIIIVFPDPKCGRFSQFEAQKLESSKKIHQKIRSEKVSSPFSKAKPSRRGGPCVMELGTEQQGLDRCRR